MPNSYNKVFKPQIEQEATTNQYQLASQSRAVEVLLRKKNNQIAFEGKQNIIRRPKGPNQVIKKRYGFTPICAYEMTDKTEIF